MILEALFLFFATMWVEKNTTQKEREDIEHERRSKAAKMGWERRKRKEAINKNRLDKQNNKNNL